MLKWPLSIPSPLSSPPIGYHPEAILKSVVSDSCNRLFAHLSSFEFILLSLLVLLLFSVIFEVNCTFPCSLSFDLYESSTLFTHQKELVH